MGAFFSSGQFCPLPSCISDAAYSSLCELSLAPDWEQLSVLSCQITHPCVHLKSAFFIPLGPAHLGSLRQICCQRDSIVTV